MTRLCSVEGCGREHIAHDYCLLHLRRTQKGQPLAGVREHLRAKISPTNLDLAWAAGFLEGEGSFLCGNGSENVTAVQVNPEPLGRLKQVFGGSVSLKEDSRKNTQDHLVWMTSGARARGIMLTLFTFMSERRQGQIIAALNERGPLKYKQGGV